jgi:hypothetical protein
VLGDLYGRCDPIAESVPVYLEGTTPELLGQADECLGHYADAISFHLPDDFCKKLSAGHFTYSFNYEHAEPGETVGRKRIKINSITLIARKAYQKPVPKNASKAAKETVAVIEAE